MNNQTLVGEQLEGQMLYERQKRIRQAKFYKPGPTILAAGLRVPENIGSVLRLADAVGSENVIFVNEALQNYPKERIHKTARNCEANVNWKLWTEQQFLQRCNEFQPLVALELTTHSTSIFECHLPSECTILVGNERHGIPRAMLEKCQIAVHIPMFGVNGSMNATHALAIALFEWRRQNLKMEITD